eukprot:1142082-Pyramimonas_sp.AAC.3
MGIIIRRPRPVRTRIGMRMARTRRSNISRTRMWLVSKEPEDRDERMRNNDSQDMENSGEGNEVIQGSLDQKFRMVASKLFIVQDSPQAQPCAKSPRGLQAP